VLIELKVDELTYRTGAKVLLMTLNDNERSD
jgi:hypothetical protein